MEMIKLNGGMYSTKDPHSVLLLEFCCMVNFALTYYIILGDAFDGFVI